MTQITAKSQIKSSANLFTRIQDTHVTHLANVLPCAMAGDMMIVIVGGPVLTNHFAVLAIV